jgi:hypothetical protein
VSDVILDKLSEKQLADHIRVALSTPSGEVLHAWLRRNCFMEPTAKPEPVANGDQALSRIGLAGLFRRIEFYRTTILPEEKKR